MTEFSWAILGRDTAPLADQHSPGFPTQADAEAWLGDNWPQL